MEYVAIITGLSLLQAFIFAINVGQQRGKHNVNAPAVSGHHDFERAYRVHQNTLEQLIIFLPALWIFANYWQADIAAALGLIFVIGRQIYRVAYMKDPSKRGAGFLIGTLAILILLAGSMVGPIMVIF